MNVRHFSFKFVSEYKSDSISRSLTFSTVKVLPSSLLIRVLKSVISYAWAAVKTASGSSVKSLHVPVVT